MFTFRAFASIPARLFRRVVDGVLAATIFAFFLLFALQFLHSPWLLHFTWVAGLKRAEDSFLAETGSWISLDWPAETGFSFIPLGMALLAWLVKIGVDGLFLKAPAVFLLPPLGASQPDEPAGSSTRAEPHTAHSRQPARNS